LGAEADLDLALKRGISLWGWTIPDEQEDGH
jgi:hypothetical protein